MSVPPGGSISMGVCICTWWTMCRKRDQFSVNWRHQQWHRTDVCIWYACFWHGFKIVFFLFVLFLSFCTSLSFINFHIYNFWRGKKYGLSMMMQHNYSANISDSTGEINEGKNHCQIITFVWYLFMAFYVKINKAVAILCRNHWIKLCVK